jgi:hypothetical protein
MDNNGVGIKPYSELRPNDYRQHPVWSWLENDWDESLVTPVAIANPLNEDDYGALFVYATLVLQDRTIMEGQVTIATLKKTVYLIEFFDDNESCYVTRNPYSSEYGTFEQLAAWLNKAVDDITPVEYITPYYFEDGMAIKGVVDLRSW